MKEYPKTVPVLIDVEPDISVNYDKEKYKILCQISVKYKLAFYYKLTDDEWQFIDSTPISEQENGLNVWEGKKWMKAQPSVQKAYSDYISEKELLT